MFTGPISQFPEKILYIQSNIMEIFSRIDTVRLKMRFCLDWDLFAFS